MFTPIYLPKINPSFIIEGKTALSLSAMQEEAYLYDVFNKDIGRQFFNNSLSLFSFRMHVIIPRFNERVISPL